MRPIAYLTLEYGALTSTFVYREVQALRERGMPVVTASVHRPRDQVISGEARSELDATFFLYARPKTARAAAVARMARRRPAAFRRTLRVAARDAAAARTSEPGDRPKMLWHFAHACSLAEWLEERDVAHVHAHFAHVATSIAMYAASLLDISFSFTGHANDLFVRGAALREKVERSAFTVCISEHNRRFLEGLGCSRDRMTIVRCGIDPAQYAFRPLPPRGREFRVLSVGRLVEKKGMVHLLDAVDRLKRRGVPVRFTVVGGGPLGESLEQRARARELDAHIELLGSQPQERVRELLREHDVFALGCVVAADGDVDGIPVSLMEAMAMGIPVVSTRVSGIPELVEHERTGLLATPADPEDLADKLTIVWQSPERAARMARDARQTIEDEFAQSHNAERLAGHLERALRQAR